MSGILLHTLKHGGQNFLQYGPQYRIYVVESLGTQIWWRLHFVMAKNLNQISFDKMVERLVVTGSNRDFVERGLVLR